MSIAECGPPAATMDTPASLRKGLITFTPFHVPCHMTHRGGGARVAAQCKWHRRIKCSSLFKLEKKGTYKTHFPTLALTLTLTCTLRPNH